jgi:hypothetical protein
MFSPKVDVDDPQKFDHRSATTNGIRKRAMPIGPRRRWPGKLVAYLMAVDRGQTHFLVIERETRTAA